MVQYKGRVELRHLVAATVPKSPLSTEPATRKTSAAPLRRMTGPSWLIDSKRIATKIINASEVDSSRFKWMSNPTKACPRCKHIIDNSDVVQEWPGLPRGVKFDPSDQELLSHLLAKVGKGDANPHPFINEFIPTVDKDDGICYTHPQKLPGVKQDGTVSHFFHRTFKAYNTGTRKRRKINDGDLGDVRWHKTGKTKPVIIDGEHLGCKKIMVLYMSTIKGEKPEKTFWVMHQYHLGTGEDEQDGEYVVSKIFCQQQFKPNDKDGQDLTLETVDHFVTQSNPVADPNLVTPEHCVCSPKQASDQVRVTDTKEDEENNAHPDLEKLGDQDNHATEDTRWWDGESQFLLDSQQLVDGIAICDEFLQSQSSCADDETKRSKPCLSDYTHIGVEVLKKDLEECQSMNNLLDHTNVELDTPPDLRLSQLEFGSQDSFFAWAGNKLAD